MPTAVLDARGSFQKDPQRRPKNEPVPVGKIGTYPKRFTAAERQAWRDIVKGACAGVLTSADRVAVEMAATLLAEFRESPRDITAPRIARLHALIGSFGMTPADRSRVAVFNKPEIKDSWSEL